MLLGLSQNRTFTITLMVILWECSIETTYGVIIGKESMQRLNVDTSIHKGTITWGERQISMVPRDYWTEERIHSQKTRLMKQPSGHLPIQESTGPVEKGEEVSALKHLNPLTTREQIWKK